MATITQIQANRLNAQKSTGPRTPEGKERASQNAIKHGLLAREAVIQGEDPGEYDLYREGMLQELAPAGAVETMLAERVVGLSWRLLRAQRLQNAAFTALDEGEPVDVLEERLDEWKQIKGSAWDRSVTGVVDEDGALGRVVVEDFAGARVLDRLLMYERRIESSLYRTMAQLRQAQQARTAAAASEEISRSDGNLPAGQESAAQAELASFGAYAAPGEQMRKTAFGSSEPPAGVAGGTRTLLVGQNHGRDAHGTHGQDARATKTLCGVAADPSAGGDHGQGAHATGMPARIEPSCETKPIPEGGPAWPSRQVPEGGRAPAAEASAIEPDGRYL